MSTADDINTRTALNYEDLSQRLHHEKLRPFRMMTTKLFRDGDQWCVLFGDNIQDGVVGFGKSPDLASRDFDVSWYAEIKMSKQEAP